MANALNNWGEKNVYPNLYRHCLNTMDQIFGSGDELLLQLQMDSFSWIGQQSISTTKKPLFLLSSTKTLPTHEKKKKNCLGAAKWKKSLVIMEKNETLSL